MKIAKALVSKERAWLLLSLVGIAGVIKIIGGTLVTIGLFTRWAAFILSGEMAVAYFWAHAPRGFAPV